MDDITIVHGTMQLHPTDNTCQACSDREGKKLFLLKKKKKSRQLT